MRILIFGSTGASGILVAREALARFQSCTLILYVRSPAKVPSDLSSNPSVIVIEGELDNQDALSKALEGVDVVLSVLGPVVSLKDGPFHPSDTPLARAYERILDLMRTHHVKRLIALGTASIADPEDTFSLKYSTMVAGVAAVAYNSYKDVVAIGKTIRSSEGIDWTIVRVPILTNSDKKDVIAGYIGDGKLGTTLGRAAFAAFMMNQIDSQEWVNKAPMITNA
ncbi:hypothetical protein CPB85DRAFT_1380874 [Mucidula mucida]|nr:hypothetical protein CPB85DRAFT_1380874 [Mucidula mucida]